MRAIRVSDYSGPEGFKLAETDVPVPTQGQVLVDVKAASVNPFDAFVISGVMKDKMPLSFPMTPGGDFAGVILEMGSGVTGFKQGEYIYGTSRSGMGGSGSMAERLVASLSSFASMPNVSFEEAAALPLVGSSAVQALTEHIKLKKDQKILVHGGGGGIGHLAVQLAKTMGAKVAVTVSKDDVEYMESLGVDVVIDYKQQKFWEMLSGYKAVFDTVGGENMDESFGVLKRGGILVTMAGQPSEELANKQGVTAIQQSTKVNRENLDKVAKLVNDKKMKINVDKVFPLEKTSEAFSYLADNSPRGKVVVKIG